MTNNKQQTAVEWLIDKHFGGIENCTPDFRNHIKQAKEMEKEKIVKAYNQDLYGRLSGYRNFDDGEDYYNQTYGGGEQ
jgi:hypothetical protein